MTSLEKSILATLIYYDVLDRPLTGWEVFRYLISKDRGLAVELKEVLNLLADSPELSKFISQTNGFYFLKNRKNIIGERIERQKISDQKWKKSKLVIKLLQIVPFVRLIILSGSLAMNNAKKNSDIDLLIIAKSGRIWTCRALISLFSQILGKRRHGALTKDRLCLNHYLTDQSLKISGQSLYNAQTYAHLTPVLEMDNGLYRRFQEQNNWLGDYLLFYPSENKGYLKKIQPNRLMIFLRKLKEGLLDGELGDRLELFLKKIQAKRITKDPLTYQTGGRVIFNDSQLEFHPDSPEKNILERYNQKMRELGFNETDWEKNSGLTV
ncbi:nucleotidyltransferase domain-containing protein [Patescibacteria group bacterium]|nr:nucleotidyltransferase domain-containing protein [Patescibacteria group bacterium]